MKLFVLLLSLLLGGCSLVERGIVAYTDRDLVRVQEMAEKSNHPTVARCASVLRDVLSGNQDLLSEDVDGPLSLAFKAYLLRESVTASEDIFKQECGVVVTTLIIELGRVLRPF